MGGEVERGADRFALSIGIKSKGGRGAAARPRPSVFGWWRVSAGSGHLYHRHPGEGRDLTLSEWRTCEIPAFAEMTE